MARWGLEAVAVAPSSSLLSPPVLVQTARPQSCLCAIRHDQPVPESGLVVKSLALSTCIRTAPGVLLKTQGSESHRDHANKTWWQRTQNLHLTGSPGESAPKDGEPHVEGRSYGIEGLLGIGRWAHSQCLAGHPRLWDGDKRVGDWCLGSFRLNQNFTFFNASSTQTDPLRFPNPLYRVGFSWICTSLSVCEAFSSRVEVFLQFCFKVAKPRRPGREFQGVFTDALSGTEWEGRIGGRGVLGKEHAPPKQFRASLICGGDQTVSSLKDLSYKEGN